MPVSRALAGPPAVHHGQRSYLPDCSATPQGHHPASRRARPVLMVLWLQVREVSEAIGWALDNAAAHGGDPARVSLLGHSAGAHLCLMALLHRAAAADAAAAPSQLDGAARSHRHAADRWGHDDGGLCTADARMPARAVLAAGVYDVQAHYEYEEAREVHMLSTMERALSGWAALRPRSPLAIVHATMRKSDARCASAGGDDSGSGGGGSGSGTPARDGVQRGSARSGVAKSGMRVRVNGVAQADAAEPAPAPAPADALPTAPKLPSFGTLAASVDAGAVQLGIEPPSHLLNPPDRARLRDAFPLAGSSLAFRVAGAKATGAAPSLRASGFSEHAADAAARFAAQVNADTVRRLPPCVFMSGTADVTVPWYESVEMDRAMRECGCASQLLLYNKVGHADWVTDWPRARANHGHARFHDDLYELLL
jgi:acetyl esterase/lipase